ncbi:unnamed protein product [Euphydryas editha]|uniref:Uncharacterized protein n=1 Tax=Euphydryas editha TaxID=104508 RepID=A0AAU9UV80_EUPED|nr:unnamed protein product [Euphydryas editha]
MRRGAGRGRRGLARAAVAWRRRGRLPATSTQPAAAPDERGLAAHGLACRSLPRGQLSGGSRSSSAKPSGSRVQCNFWSFTDKAQGTLRVPAIIVVPSASRLLLRNSVLF